MKFAHSQHVLYLTPDIGFLLRVDMAICEVRISGLTDAGSNTSGSHYTLRTVRTQMGRGPHSLDEVSPLDETALARQLKIPSNVRLETSRLGPKMTGPTKTEESSGDETSVGGVDIVRIRGGTHLRGKEFPEGAKRPKNAPY